MTGKLAEALAKVQAKLPTVHKGKTASIASSKGSYSYSYADLADVTAAIMPLLAANGLSFSCMPHVDERGSMQLRGVLLHTSGESLTGALPLSGGTPQQLGSSITYMRRYLLGSMTGVVTDDDDDARTATEAAKEARRQIHQAAAQESVPRITEQQQKRMHASLGELAKVLGSDEVKSREGYLKLASWVAEREVESTSELSKAEAVKLIDYLSERIASEKAKAAASVAPEAGEPGA